MKEIFEYIYNENIERIADNRLSFKFTHFDIVFEFSDEIDINDDIFEALNENRPISEINFSLFPSNFVNGIFLRGYVYIEEYEIDVKGHYGNSESITYQLFEIVNKIKKNYPDAILDYNLGSLNIEGCGDWLCPDNGWYYGYEIRLDKSFYFNKKFYDFLIHLNLCDSKAFIIPEFYNTEKELKDNYELKILNSNTKIRRLGYLKILLKMFKEQSKVPISKINSKFEKYCQDYNFYLEIHKNKKGNVIVTKTGNSANPYVELAINLGLIHKSAGVYEVGKIGKVYNILKEKIDISDTNPFVFSTFDISFFLEMLLKEDYWYLFSIMEQTAINQAISFKSLKKEFKQILKTQIRQFIDEAQLNNSKRVLSLKVLERRINEWKKPEVYMEHVLMPRLNWLYDMNLIELKVDLSFQLTETGKKLLFNLAVWNDIALHKIVSPVAYIDNYYMRMIDSVFSVQNRKYTKEADEDFLNCLDDSFILFKTLAPNRITFSLFAKYAKYMLFWNKSVIVDTENIKKAFELKRVPNFIFKYQEHYKDGYIQKNNSI